MEINNLEAQFIKTLFEAAQWDLDAEQKFHNQVGSIIEDIWDAPEAWPEYNEFYGEENRDSEKIRTDLVNIAAKWGITIDDWMRPYLKPENIKP